MAGGYNREAVTPFLGEEDPNYQEERDYFRGRAAFPDTLQEEDRQYYYHATTMRNLISILQTGLDPQRGGIRGAGTLIAGDEDYRETEVEDAQNPPQQGFNQDSHGYVFASEHPEVVAPYAFAYDDMADAAARAGGEMENAPVVLRFRRDVLEVFENDPAQPGAIMTRQPIRWEQLEILTEEGWTPLIQPLENDRFMRDEIYDNVSAILNAGRSTAMTGARLGEPDQGPAPKRPPEPMSVLELVREEGMGQAGTTKKPGGAENSRDKSIGK